MLAATPMWSFRRHGQPLRAEPVIGPMVYALRDHGVTAPIDVHLMVKPVDRMISDFIEAGLYPSTPKPEHIDRSLQPIRDGV